MNWKGKLNGTIETALSIHAPWLTRWEFRRQNFSKFNERPIEFGFVFKNIGRHYPKTILDVGTGRTSLPHLMRNCGCLVTAIDNITDYWARGMRNRHYHVIDDDICNTKIKDKFDLVTCISVLEHIRDHDAAVRNMLSLLNPDGRLIITCPYTENSYIDNVYNLPGSNFGQDASYTTQSYSRTQLDKWLIDNDAILEEQEYWQFWEGDHWTVGNETIPPISVSHQDKHQHTCLLIRKKGQNNN